MPEVTAGDGEARAQGLVATARSLATDRVTGEVVRSFRNAGVPSILVKGPTVAEWLYDDGSVRFYLDSDLWVPPGRFEAAERILDTLGFERRDSPVELPKGLRPHAEPWFRARDRAEVDLHRTLSGVGVAPEEAWADLSGLTEPMAVGGERVDVLPLAVRALLVVLHAAQHGPDKAKPLEDLSRALARLSAVEWRDVAEIAMRLDATPGFAYGLRLHPEGVRMAEQLGLVSSALIEHATRDGSAARVALGLQRLSDAPTVRERMRLLRNEFVPSPAFLRWWSPLARRGPLGLAAAYVWRPFWLLWHAGPSLLIWRRTRADGRR